MAEVLLEFDDRFSAPDGRSYRPRVCGRARDDRLWEGWIEFVPSDGDVVLRTGRETTQPSRDMLRYWATGLTWGYLDGALLRTLRPARPLVAREAVASAPAYEGPAERRPAGVEAAAARPVAVLDPFAVFAEGDDVLRGQLNALSPGQLRNIIRAHGLDERERRTLEDLPKPALVERIMEAARKRTR